MKKICLCLLIAGLFAGCTVFADVVTTTRKINRQPQTQTQTQNNTKKYVQRSTGNKLADNVKMCKPYSENLNSPVAGIDFTFNVRIEGWVNNKCRLNFNAKSTGISEMFKSIYGVDASDATITTFEPKIRCDFTKQQLEYVGDSILQETERNAGAKNNMLKNPQDITIPNVSSMSGSDLALMDVILNQKACTILNAGDSGSMFESLFSY